MLQRIEETPLRAENFLFRFREFRFREIPRKIRKFFGSHNFSYKP